MTIASIIGEAIGYTVQAVFVVFAIRGAYKWYHRSGNYELK